MTATTTTHYAAIDENNVTGAVYGVGRTGDEALANASRDASEGGGYALVPCTAAAAAYVEEHGGAPSSDLTVSRTGVCLRSEEA